MKELPYFRFTVSEWLNDDISLESLETKGLFIDVCSYYWFKDCYVSWQMLRKRFANAEQLLKQLIESKIIKISDDEFIYIKFLDIQYEKASHLSSIRSKCAKMKGLQNKQKQSKSKAIAKQKHIYKDKEKDKEKDKDNLNTRTQNFLDKLSGFSNRYDKSMLVDFGNYWSEPNRSKTKMKCELEKTWDTSRRLATWFKNQSKFGAKRTVYKTAAEKEGEAIERLSGRKW